MSKLENIISSLPDYAKDIKLNIKAVLNPEGSALSEKQINIVAVASAIATKNQKLIEAIEEKATVILSEQEINAAKSAAAIMAMNNIYYRFLHLATNKEYSKLPAGLRMQIIANHGIEKTDFELASLAVSAINGCGMCIDSHEAILVKHGVKIEVIQAAVKIAAVLNAVGTLA